VIPVDSRVVDGLLATVGVTALLLAVLVAYAPSVVPVGAVESVLTPATASLVLGVGAVGAVAAVAHRALFREDGDGDDPAVTLPTPPVAAERDRADVETPGDWIDDRLATLRGETGDADGTGYASFVETRVAQRIRELAVDVVADAESCSEREAQRMIDDGTWTDRPRAKVLLGDDVPDLPLSVRVRDWASGERVDRQVRATVEELAALTTVDLESELAPDRVETGDGSGEPWPTPDPGAVDLEDADPEGFYRPGMFDDELPELGLGGTDDPASAGTGDVEGGTDPPTDRPATERAGGERQ
jgi:hypothetical protein